MTNSLAELNQRFALTEQLTFTQTPGGLTVATISNTQATATISLCGGQVTAWQPVDELPVLWLGDPATFTPGRAIRGGVPVCWPWFGPHVSEAELPSHGFARTSPWTVTHTDALPDGAIRIVLTLHPNGTHPTWPYAYSLQSRITVGRELRIELVTNNRGTAPFVISEALHTYFSISDVRNTPIHGLEKRIFVDKADGGRRKIQDGAVMIDGEIDRVYLDAATDVTIDDIGHRRRIRVHQQGSHSTIVWNPGENKAKTIDGFGPEDHLRMVCVESGNVLDNAVTVAPGEEHTLTACYRVEPLK